jgi:hypothetical protein
VADRVVLDAELVTGLRPEDLIDIDRQWLPLRQRVVRRLRDAGVPRWIGVSMINVAQFSAKK